MHPGPGTDIPAFIFGSILAVEMFRMFFEGEKNLSTILICIFLGFSSKMSFLTTAALSIIAVYNDTKSKPEIVRIGKNEIWFLSRLVYLSP